jgi:hypothetical protein
MPERVKRQQSATPKSKASYFARGAARICNSLRANEMEDANCLLKISRRNISQQEERNIHQNLSK